MLVLYCHAVSLPRELGAAPPAPNIPSFGWHMSYYCCHVTSKRQFSVTLTVFGPLLAPQTINVGDGLIDAGREVAAAAQEAASAATSTANKVVSKKRKLGKAADISAAAAEGPLQEEPRATLQGHSQCVAGVSWPEEESIYTGSWDHSVSVCF